MRKVRIIPRSTATIVQQMNTISTRDALKKIANNAPLDLPSGTSPRTYDFDDQSNVDFDKPRFGQMSNPQFDGFENLIDQHCNAAKISEHLHPTPPVADPLPPVADPLPPVVDPVPPTE